MLKVDSFNLVVHVLGHEGVNLGRKLPRVILLTITLQTLGHDLVLSDLHIFDKSALDVLEDGL